MAVYYVVITALAGSGYLLTEKKKQSQKATAIYLAVAFGSLVLLASFRYAIGFDYFAYRDIYEMSAQMSFRDIFHTHWYEPLYHFICRIFAMNGIPYQVFLACISCFVLTAAMWFISHYSKIPWMGVYFYITLQFLAYDMNLIRQSMALCFFMFAYPYLIKRKIVPYTLLMLAGGFIHNSLWFVYPLYFLLLVKFTKKTAAAFMALAVSGYIWFDDLFQVIQPFLPLKYASYQGSYYWNASGMVYVVPSLLYLILTCLHQSSITCVSLRCIYLNSAFYNFLISLFLTRHFILERFAVYPFVISLAAIPDMINGYKEMAGKEDGAEERTGKENAAEEKAIIENAEEKIAIKKVWNRIAGGIKKCQTFQSARIQFLLFGALSFLFAAARGFHHVYPYISLLQKSSSVPIP